MATPTAGDSAVVDGVTYRIESINGARAALVEVGANPEIRRPSKVVCAAADLDETGPGAWVLRGREKVKQPGAPTVSVGAP